MTTTSTFSGMDLEKPSSKVLAPPGGRSNICFGGDPEPQQRTQQPRQQKTEATPPPVQQDNSGPAKSCKPQNTAGQTQSNIFGSGDPNNWPKPTSGKRRIPEQNSTGGFNLLSGEPISPDQGGANRKQQKGRIDPASMPAAGSRIEERQVTRRKPPGGESSFSFGN